MVSQGVSPGKAARQVQGSAPSAACAGVATLPPASCQGGSTQPVAALPRPPHSQALQEGVRPAGHGFPGEAVWRAGRSKGKVFRRGVWGGVSPPCPTHAFFRNNKVRASEHGWGKPLLNAGVPGFLGFLPIVPGSGVGREQRTQLPPSRSPRVPLCLVRGSGCLLKGSFPCPGSGHGG